MNTNATDTTPKPATMSPFETFVFFLTDGQPISDDDYIEAKTLFELGCKLDAANFPECTKYLVRTWKFIRKIMPKRTPVSESQLVCALGGDQNFEPHLRPAYEWAINRGYFITAVEPDFRNSCAPTEKGFSFAEEEKPEETSAHVFGVSVQAIANILSEGDDKLRKELLKKWKNSGQKKPQPLAKSARHAQIWIYRPAEILDYIEKIEVYLKEPKPKLLKRLIDIAEKIN